ncbi:FIST C-terminal domain-containing protein [Ruminococcaceae bacterium OttesenSCG-928-I18]|nr:FIST C-terminal domain-containing protein [Ruminococcaceae bacterium OttesenSCG-928-I18]
MLKMLTSYTYEADDVSAAVEEILGQLDLENNALAHSAGLILCYSDFVGTGVVEALCKAVPFEVVGCTTLGLATGAQVGTVMLTFTVFTSDEVQFSTALAQDLGDNQKGPIHEAWHAACEKLGPARPGLCLTFSPMLKHVGGDILSRELNDAAGATPVFGTIACDDNPDYSDARTIYHGDACREAMALLLMSDEVKPRFFMGSIPDDKIQREKAIITRAEHNIINEVNGKPFIEYAKTLGLYKGDGIEGMNTIPLIIDYGDGAPPVAAAIYMLSEDGAICGVPTPQNATLAIGSIDVPDILATTARLSGEIAGLGQVNGILAFSCLARGYVLGADIEAEFDLLRRAFGATPYTAGYAGGEFCPLYRSESETVNRFHNFTFIGCVL